MPTAFQNSNLSTRSALKNGKRTGATQISFLSLLRCSSGHAYMALFHLRSVATCHRLAQRAMPFIGMSCNLLISNLLRRNKGIEMSIKHVVLGTGAIGRAIMEELIKRGESVRM